MAAIVSHAAGGVLGDSTETDMRNLIAERPYKVGNCTFDSVESAEAYASAQADLKQSEMYVIDRRNGVVISVFEP